MKYLKELQRKKLFGLSYAETLTGNTMTAKSMLQAYKKAGYIIAIRRNLYVALDLASKAMLANCYEIGSAINKGAYISHHSALEYHGIANQVFFTMTVSSPERFTPFSCDGITYMSYQSKILSGIQTPITAPLVRVTDLERTIIDCIYDLNQAGGIEEVLESLRLIPQLDVSKLLAYLEEYNQIFLWQKAGFFLEHFAEKLHISKDFFDECKSKINNRKKYLTDDKGQIYFADWKLYAPNNLFYILEEGERELV